MERQVERKALARAKKWSASSSALRLAASSSGSCPAPLRAKLRSLSGFAAASLIALLLATAAWAQISPGPLSRAHQSLSGPTQCTSCHKVGVGKADLKCLECHVEIAQRLAEQRGLHATLVAKGSTGRDCARCHSEHNGPDFNLIQWDPSPKAFDHSKTGYVLEGKHAGLTCVQCHTPQHIRAAERGTILMKDLKRTFLGLSRDCLSCHRDEHRGQLGTNCLQCHTYSEWKGAPRFNHAQARYPLTGAHALVPCMKCHPTTPEPAKFVKYVGLAFEKCSACHADPHSGAFPNACESCHNTSGWHHTQAAARFDHSKTDFPLLGKHASVSCGQCHLAGNFKQKIAHQNCANCHKPDPHGGQFRQRPDRGECASCHTVEGFKPAQFGVREHAATQYPLEGRHAEVPCAKCHLPAGRATRYKISFARCTDCHSDPHNGQFTGQPHLNKCEDCHTVQGFQPSTFTLARHQSTRFPLTGGHVAVACVDCHKADDARRPGHAVPYRFEDRSCTACHVDPHRGQFLERMRKPNADGSLPGCEACHVVKSWRELSRFDHSTTSFKLLGAHRAVPCASCHKPEKPETSLKAVDFRSAPSHCENCHEEVHGGQFAAPGQLTNCASCHNSTKWKPSLFDHETGSTFSLQGAHQEVACALCHKTIREVNGKPVLFYKPTPRECAACHGSVPGPKRSSVGQ